MELNERYQKYYNTLVGKQSIEQYLKVFQNNNDDINFFACKSEDDKFWIVNITKLIYKSQLYVDKKYKIGNNCYTLYMQKNKDFVVLKASINNFLSSKQYNNNINTYVNYKLHKLGYTKSEFINGIKTLLGYYQECKTIKIFIPPDKSEEDLVELISFIDKLNDIVINQPGEVWDNMLSIKEKVDILF